MQILGKQLMSTGLHENLWQFKLQYAYLDKIYFGYQYPSLGTLLIENLIYIDHKKPIILHCKVVSVWLELRVGKGDRLPVTAQGE